MHQSTLIQRALLSVSDKSNIIPLAECLHLQGVQLISTGNTAKLLKEQGFPVVPIHEYTGFPEIMDGRVKTLHPKIYGGILGRRDIDLDVMLTHDIPDIDLVVVNLYPFQKVIQNPNAPLEEAIENIDIGGPTLLRAAAKNHEWCTVLTDTEDYDAFIREFINHAGKISPETRFRLATKVFANTAAYDAAIAQFLARKIPQKEKHPEFPSQLSLHYDLKERLRYGENPHQHAAFYQESSPPKDSITACTQLQGKELSYNNIADSDTALECVKTFNLYTKQMTFQVGVELPSHRSVSLIHEDGEAGEGNNPENSAEQCIFACVIVKHANPCGVAIGKDCLDAYQKAYQCDPISAFGGVLAFNQPVNADTLQPMLKQQFIEVLIAPEFSAEAILLAKQKPNIRLLQYHPIHSSHPHLQQDIRSVNGGILVQSWDHYDKSIEYKVVSKHGPSQSQLQDLIFSWHVAKCIKSNGIVYARHGQTLGIGAGQMSRIFSTEIGALKAKQAHLSLEDAVMASDAFFPFKDNIEKAYEYGIRAIIQPGGSMRDEEVIACANELGMVMILTGKRHFRH